MFRYAWFPLLIAVAGPLFCLSAAAEDPPPEKLSGWQKLFRRQAAGYKFAIEGKGEAEVKLLEEPILHWSQPVRGGADGAVFLWTQEGRPIAIGTFFIWPMNNGKQGISHELHSLSVTPFVATWKDRKWTPPTDSLLWTAFPSAPVPADSVEQRMRQMRELSRDFKAESTDKNDRKWDLRLLPRPIYRYSLGRSAARREPEILDGALHAFVEGTDLEVVLLIQARKSAKGYQWEFALARMSDFRLKVSLADKLVWEVDRAGFDNPRVAYYCGTVESRTSAEEE